MARQITRRDALTRGQLARKWGVSVERIKGLIEAGCLPAFVIPASGKFGKVVKVPVAVVLEAEKKWKITPVSDATFPVGNPGHHQVGAGETAPATAEVAPVH